MGLTNDILDESMFTGEKQKAAKTVLFLSPQFPPNFVNFIIALRKAGCAVVALGDTPYHELNEVLLQHVNEYLVVNMEDYAQVYRETAGLIYRHGRIDWVQSHNEHWLILEARIREDFNISDGYRFREISEFSKKSVMKGVFRDIGLQVARGKVMRSYEEVLSFVHGSKGEAGVGYPIVGKPDHGVGATSTYKLRSDAQVKEFFDGPYIESGLSFIFEELVVGTLLTFDGLADKDGNVIFYGSFQYKMTPMEMLLSQFHPCYFMKRQVEADVLEAGLRMVKAFNVRGHFFHFELFRREEDGVLVPLEANLRIPGAFAIDLYNYAYNVDLYQLWADVVADDRSSLDAFSTRYNADPHGKYFSCYIGRRARLSYAHAHDEVLAQMVDYTPGVEPIKEMKEDGDRNRDSDAIGDIDGGCPDEASACAPSADHDHDDVGSKKDTIDDDGEWVQMLMHLQMPEMFQRGMGEYSYYFRTPSYKALWRTIAYIHETL